MSLDSTLLIASGGLANVSRAMAVISHNVANANTPDYVREVTTQTALTAGGVGFGVFSGPVRREVDLQLQKELTHQSANVAGLTVRNTALQGVDAAQGVPGGGSDLGSILGKLHDGFISLQSDPSSAASQAHVVSAGAALVGKLNALSGAYTTARQNAQDSLATGIASLNAAIVTVSGLTDRIVASQQTRQGTADLENQRDTAMHAMGKLVDVTFIQQPDGGLLGATAGGLAITLREPAPKFTMAPSYTAVQNSYPGGGIQPVMLAGADVTAQLTGGEIGANMTLRDRTLPQYQAGLDEFANTLQTRFVAQGLQLFTGPVASSTGIVPAPVQTGYLGYAGSIAVNPAVEINPAQVRDGNVTVVGSPTGGTNFTSNPAGGPASFSTLIDRVITFAFGSQVQPGVLQPPPSLSGLGPAGQLAAPFAMPPTLSAFATTLVAAQSADAADVDARFGTETAVQTALQARIDSRSGVDTDSELTAMVGLQTAYGANAKIITATQSMWTQLLAAVT